MAKVTSNAPVVTQGKNTVKSLIDTLIKLDAQADSVFVDMAAALYQAKKQDAHVSAGYPEDHGGFVAFCDEKLRCGYRKAQYFVSIWEKSLEVGISKEVMEAVGWSKMKELVPIITTENAAELLKVAQEKSLKNLLEHIASMKRAKKESKSADGVNSSAVNVAKYSFVIDLQDNDTVHTALEEAKARMETSNAAEGFVTICQDWLALGGGSLPNTLEDYMLLIERNFGVRLAILEKDISVRSETTPVAGKVASMPLESPAITETPEDEVSDVSKNTDAITMTLMKMAVGDLKAFAADKGIIVPQTVKGKVAMREFILDALLKGHGSPSVDDVPTPDSDDLDALDDLDDTTPSVAEDVSETIPDSVPDDDGEVDLEVADHATLLDVAAKYKVDVPKNLKPAKQVEVLRKHVIDSLRAMGYGDEPEENLPESAVIVAAEEEKDALDAVSDTLKGIAGFLKDKGYAETYITKFGKPNNKSDLGELYANTLSLISEKFGVSFSEEDAETEDDLL